MRTPEERAQTEVTGIRHISSLDGLRAIAIVMVLFAHGIDDVPVRLHHFAESGWVGVDLFFALSGFLITGGLLRTKSASNYFISFYGRRMLRIFPIFYFALLITFGVLPWFISSPPLPPKHDYIFYWLYLNNWALLLRLPNTQYVGHFWSLAVEEQFYFLWPAVVFWLNRKQLTFVAIGCVILSPILRTILVLSHVQLETIYRNTFCRMDSLMIGALCALLVATPSVYRHIRGLENRLLLAGVIIWIAVVTALHFVYYSRQMIVFGLTSNAICAGLVLLGTIVPGRVSAILGWKPLRMIGVWSYGIYVYHLAFIHFAHAVPFLPPGILRFAAENLAAILFAAASYHYFEAPILSLKHRFAPRFPSVGEKLVSA